MSCDTFSRKAAWFFSFHTVLIHSKVHFTFSRKSIYLHDKLLIKIYKQIWAACQVAGYFVYITEWALSSLTHMCAQVVKKNHKMASSVLFLCVCYRCCAKLATDCDQCRLLAMGFGLLLPTGTRASVPQQSFGRHRKLLPSSHRLPLLHSVRRQQETHMPPMWAGCLFQPKHSELPLAAGGKVWTQCYYETGEPPFADMRSGQTTSSWLWPRRKYLQRSIVLRSFLQVHGRSESKKQMSFGSTLQRPAWCLWQSLQSRMQTRH